MNKWLLFSALILSIVAALAAQEAAPYRLGIEQFSPDLLGKFTGKTNARVGLITNQSGKDQKGNRSIDLLLKKGINVVMIFAPEHGLHGTVSAGKKIDNSVDTATKLPITSLYTLGKKDNETSYKDTLDAFIFDIQDVGMRHYTYSATLLSVLGVAAKQSIPLIVLDRPNPLGIIMEGAVSSIENSFLASVPIMLRHAMTMAEIARYCNSHVLTKPAQLHIVPLKDYSRKRQVAKLIAPLSPNIQNVQACEGYSFLGLLGEIQPFDVGVGTKDAFRIIGLPHTKLNKKQNKQLAALLQSKGIHTKSIDYYNQRKKKQYHGLKITHIPINSFSAFNTFLSILAFCKQHNITLTLSKDFDAALGSSIVRDYMSGLCSFEQLQKKINADLQAFYVKAKSAFIYEPLPKMVLVE